MNILKRVTPLFLALCTVLGCVVCTAQPVSAAETRWDDLLETYSVSGSGDNMFTVDQYSNTDMVFNIDQRIINDVDIVVFSTSYLSSCTIEVNGGQASFEMNVLYIAKNMYRIYGSLGKYAVKEFDFDFGVDGYSYMQLLQFNVSSLGLDYYHESVTLITTAGTYAIPANDYSYTWALQSTNDAYVATFDIDDMKWHRYDYMDIRFMVEYASIDSIVASIGANTVPIEISYLDYEYSSYDTIVYVNVHLNLKGIDRAWANNLIVRVAGMANSEESYITTYGVTCFVEQTVQSGEVTWLQKIYNGLSGWFSQLFSKLSNWFTQLFTKLGNWFDSVISAVKDGFASIGEKLDALVNGTQEQQDAAEDYKNSAADQADKMDQAVTDMNVSKVDPDDIDVSVNTITGGLDFSYLNKAMLTITGSSTVYQCLIMAVSLMLVSYVLFGKKG